MATQHQMSAFADGTVAPQMDLSAPSENEWRYDHTVLFSFNRSLLLWNHRRISYEMRRECQEIIPGLLLGPFVVSKQLDKLIELRVTHIVCIRDAKEAWSVYPRFTEHFHYLVLDVEDNEEQNLIRLFGGAQKFIDQAIQNGGRVLVHCNGGISLSPAFAIMFVMQHFRLSWEDALLYVQNRRYCISPNGGFLTQLKEWESIYRASQAASMMTRVAPDGMRLASARRKRGTDEEDDDEAETMIRQFEHRKRTLRPEEVDTEMA